jgi:hypothetical protein
MKFRIVLFLLTTFMAGITLSGQNINKKIYINGLVVGCKSDNLYRW